MYIAINLIDKSFIICNAKSLVSKFTGIGTTTLWKLLKNNQYVEYKDFIIINGDITRIVKSKNYNHINQMSERFKQINRIISDEKDYDNR